MSSKEDPVEPTPLKNTQPPQSDAGAETFGAVDDQAIEEMAAEVWGQSTNSQSDAEAIIDAEAVDAEEVGAKDAGATVVTAEAVNDFTAPPVCHGPEADYDVLLATGIYADPEVPAAFNQINMQTKGGAIGGVLLGLLSIGGAWLTGYSIFNAALGLMLSCWGLRSSARQWAGAGIALSLVGGILSILFRR